MRPRSPAAAAFVSAREHRRLMQKGVVVDLLDEEIRYVSARDEPTCPAARIDQRAIGFRLWPAGQDHGTHDHPVELAPADDAFLHVLVVINAPQQQMESHVIKKPATAMTVARPEARYADQTLDSSLLHRGDEHLGRLREKPRRLEDDFRPSRNTKRLDDGIDAGQRALHGSHLERVASNFFEFGVTNTYSSG